MALDAPRTTADVVTISGLEQAVGGYLHGLTQPFLQARLRFGLPSDVDWTGVDDAFVAALPNGAAPQGALSDTPLAGAVERVIHWTAEFQRGAGDGVFEAGRILWRAADGAELTVVALPTLDANIATAALNVVVVMINRGLGDALGGADLVRAVRAEIDQLGEDQRRSPIGPEMRLYLKAAHERGVPWLRLGLTAAFQIGYGARGRWLESSFTDATCVTGAQVARNKAAAASVLRQVGLPAPPHLAVLNADMAVAAAEELGYPVVVKPLDQDGGVGVRVGLRTPAAVRRAFTEAKRHSDRILVETFVEGLDYRLVVFQGRLIWAVERVPAQVVGDGASTVRQLVGRLNADPRRTDQSANALKPLIFDEEAVELLAEYGMDGDSVPSMGQRIRLRGAANVASGGVPIPVFVRVHPDNRLLAERAAKALRLDVAGVDLIMPDIGRSWTETGAGICEVNGAPGFSTAASAHVYGQIVEGLTPGDGRIPIALLVGSPAASTAPVLIARIVAAAGVRAGVAGPAGVWIGQDSILPGSADVFTGARLLLGDRTVEAAIVAVNDSAPSRLGLPFDRCDVIALAGSRLGSATDESAAFDGMASSLLPMAAGRVVVNARDPACMALASLVPDGQLILYAAEPGLASMAEHRAKGGAAVWLEEREDGPLIVIATGADTAMTLALGDPGLSAAAFECAAEDVALAVSVAGALGCDEGHLRRGLAGVRLGA